MKKGFKQPFGWAPNTVINDPQLTLKAKGLWLYINSKPEGWDFSVRGVTIQNRDGKDGVNSGLKELEKFGYLHREQKVNKAGQFNGYLWTLYDAPGERAEPLQDLTVTVKPAIVKPDTSNKELVIQTLSNTDKGEQNKNFASLPFKKWNLKDFQDSIQEAAEGKGYDRAELVKFYNCWKEPNNTGKKMRFQLGDTWSTSGRLVTWMGKVSQYGGHNDNKGGTAGADGFQQIIDQL